MSNIEALTGTPGTTKTQLRGNCQCCGRHQAVPNGRMSKHGYEVKDRGNYGYFKGVCSGDNYEPLQVKRDIADGIVATCRADAVRLDQRAADLKSGKVKPEHVQGHYLPAKREYERLPFDSAAPYQQKEAIESAVWQATQRAGAARSFADQLEAMANEKHGKPLDEVRVDAGPAPILIGEKRKDAAGRVYTVTRVNGARIYWNRTKTTGEGTFSGWTGSQAFRRYEMAVQA